MTAKNSARHRARDTGAIVERCSHASEDGSVTLCRGCLRDEIQAAVEAERERILAIAKEFISERWHGSLVALVRAPGPPS